MEDNLKRDGGEPGEEGYLSPFSVHLLPYLTQMKFLHWNSHWMSLKFAFNVYEPPGGQILPHPLWEEKVERTVCWTQSQSVEDTSLAFFGNEAITGDPCSLWRQNCHCPLWRQVRYIYAFAALIREKEASGIQEYIIAKCTLHWLVRIRRLTVGHSSIWVFQVL